MEVQKETSFSYDKAIFPRALYISRYESLLPWIWARILGWAVSWLQAIVNRRSSSYGVSSMLKRIQRRHCPLLFYISSSVFLPSARRVASSCGREAAPNNYRKHTIFIVCSSSRLPWAGESEQEETRRLLVVEATLAETMPDERSYSHTLYIRAYNRALPGCPEEPEIKLITWVAK